MLWIFLLWSVTTPIKNFLITVKNCLSSLIPIHSPSLSVHTSTSMMLNCRLPWQSGCMTINCPPCCSTIKQCTLTCWAHDGPIQNNDTMYHASSSCPDLDPLSSMDSLQTHDSPVTPESPWPYSPSPDDTTERHDTLVTQVGTEGDDLLTYDSLVTILSWLSLEP